MSASGSTPNLGLPIYQNSDTPKFIPDFNSAMTAIDGGYKENKDAVAQTNTSLGQTNENVTAAQSTANQALATANLVLEKLVNINDIAFTTDTGWTIDYDYIKVVNGIFLGLAFFGASTPTLQPVVHCNYNISANGLLLFNDKIQTLYFANGVSAQYPNTITKFALYFSSPWNPSWTKIS